MDSMDETVRTAEMEPMASMAGTDGTVRMGEMGSTASMGGMDGTAQMDSMDETVQTAEMEPMGSMGVTDESSVTWASTCGAEPWGAAAPERMYGFVPEETGTYRIDLTGDFNAMFTLYEGCPATVDAPCV